MSEGKIDQITEAMRHEQYRFCPARRVYIPKKNGKLRPLGLPSWSDKLIGEVVRLLLEAYYEPQFSDRSHGFRKGRGCHTALREIREVWKGATWFIEGDISDCFGSLDHEVMAAILAEKIHDQRFPRLIRHMAAFSHPRPGLLRSSGCRRYPGRQSPSRTARPAADRTSGQHYPFGCRSRRSPRLAVA